MTINELSQYYYLSKEIQKDKYRIVELRSKAEKITVSTLGFPLSKTENSKVEKGVIAIADIEEIIKLNIQKRYYEEKRIREYIDNINGNNMAVIDRLSDCGYCVVSNTYAKRSVCESVNLAKAKVRLKEILKEMGNSYTKLKI